jgi:methyl-accepting chemotaxis protein
MSFLSNRLTIKIRIALVSVAFVAGLCVIGAAYLLGSREIAAAFKQAKASAALEQRTSDIAAATIALKVVSRDIRFRREGSDLQAFADGLAKLSSRIDGLAGAASAEAFSHEIAALKTEIGAIAQDFDAVQKLQQALGAAGSGGLNDKVEQSGQTLTSSLKTLISNEDTLDIERLFGALTTMRRIQSEFKTTFDDSLTGEWEVNFGRFERTLKRAEIDGEAKAGLANTFKDYADGFRAWSAVEKDFMLAAEKETGGFDVIAPILQQLGEKVSAEGEAAGARLAAAEALTRQIILVTILSALVAGLASAIVVGRTTANPLARLRDAMLALAGGDLGVEIPALSRVDEIGQMANAVQTLKEAALDRERLGREASDQRELTDAERQRNEAERARFSSEQERVVAVIAAGHEQLSRGNLTFRIDEAFPAAYQKLKDDFNAAIAQMGQTMSVVLRVAQDIRADANEMSRASDDLSRRTEQQAASLEETAAALDEITATIKKSAKGAAHAREVVAVAEGDARKGTEVVRDAVQAMDAIAKSAQEISQIIGVIDEIAFQTNLLALNAGVEAARAGDAGRGFAVVASEVRALAQRSADAAKQIKGLIAASTNEVDHGVKLVAETGAALERIMAQVADVNGAIVAIAAGAEEQAIGLDEVNAAINQMDQVTQQNAAMVEESTSASRSLSEETAQLSDLVGQFQVGGAHEHEDDAKRRPPQKADARAHARSPAPVRRSA